MTGDVGDHLDVAAQKASLALALKDVCVDLPRGDEVGLDVNIGLHPYHNNLHNMGIFVMGDLSARYEGRGNDTLGTTGGKRISLGPVLVGYWNNVMLRGEVKFPVYENVRGTQVGRGIDFNLGIGVTF